MQFFFRMTEEMSIIGSEAYNAAKEILEAACLVEGDLFVVGCSTSEVAGAGIGTFSSPELAEVDLNSITFLQNAIFSNFLLLFAENVVYFFW